MSIEYGTILLSKMLTTFSRIIMVSKECCIVVMGKKQAKLVFDAIIYSYNLDKKTENCLRHYFDVDD